MRKEIFSDTEKNTHTYRQILPQKNSVSDSILKNVL